MEVRKNDFDTQHPIVVLSQAYLERFIDKEKVFSSNAWREILFNMLLAAYQSGINETVNKFENTMHVEIDCTSWMKYVQKARDITSNKGQ